MELGNHAEFLGVMTRQEMLAMFFVHDGGESQKWRLKGHAQTDFWEWLCSWAVMVRRPSDLGYDDDGFILPALDVKQVTVHTEATGGYLFQMEAHTLQERQAARRDSLAERVAKCAEMVNGSDQPWLVWCNLNCESEAIAKAIGAVEVTGSDTNEHKEESMVAFSDGEIKRLVTKPKIAGFGMNWQHCNNVAFVGLSDSFEQYYQAIRRCWRFGQHKTVNCYIITADTEGAVVRNIERKAEDAERMAQNMVENMHELNEASVRGTQRTTNEYRTQTATGDGWKLTLGDCVDVAKTIPSDSIHYSVFSPPFSSLYTYSNSPRDMGNCKGDDDFWAHFAFLIPELFRLTMPGRLCSVHCADLPAMKERDGYIGLKDFSGQIMAAFQAVGWIYHARVTIWKDPLIEATRTKAIGLMYKQVKKDSNIIRHGLPDYVLTFRKPGENPEPIENPEGTIRNYIGADDPGGQGIQRSHNIWRRYASPVWMDIRQSNTLNKQAARDKDDERHICPLQLDVIMRLLTLWTNGGDTVFSPFAGIASEGYCARKMGRKFKGSELKESYFTQGCKNLTRANEEAGQDDLFAI